MKYEVERKIRKIFLQKKKYYEYTLSLPKIWVEAVIKKLGIKAEDLLVKLILDEKKIIVTPVLKKRHR